MKRNTKKLFYNIYKKVEIAPETFDPCTGRDPAIYRDYFVKSYKSEKAAKNYLKKNKCPSWQYFIKIEED